MRSTWAIRKRPGAISAKSLSAIQTHITCNAHACTESQNGSFLALRGECCLLQSRGEIPQVGLTEKSTEFGFEVGSFFHIVCMEMCQDEERDW